MKAIKLLACLGLSALALPAASAQESGFEPLSPCEQVLKDYAPAAAVWASGYLSGMQGTVRELDFRTLASLGEELSGACKAAPQTEFVNIVKQLATSAPPPGIQQTFTPAAMPPDVPDIARSLVEKFLVRDIELAEILRSVQPTRAEVATLYPASMVDRLDEIYQNMFGTMLEGENFPKGPIELTVGFTSTFELGQADFLDELPGGFKQVLDLFQVDVPFGYIEVHFSQVQDSMQLSGFVYLNDHWVLMPRPWRAVD